MESNFRLIPLSRGLFAKVDQEDYQELIKTNWCIKERHDRKCMYAASRKGSMHRIILGAKNGEIVDHINGDGLDNRRCNIRICTQSVNSVNKATKGKYMRGVYHKKGMWFAYAKKDGKQYHLGRHATELDAHKAYIVKMQRKANPVQFYTVLVLINRCINMINC